MEDLAKKLETQAVEADTFLDKLLCEIETAYSELIGFQFKPGEFTHSVKEVRKELEELKKRAHHLKIKRDDLSTKIEQEKDYNFKKLTQLKKKIKPKEEPGVTSTASSILKDQNSNQYRKKP